MKETFYERIGEAVCRERLTNGLEVCVVPKPGYAKKYAFFSTRYGGMDTRFCLDGQCLRQRGQHPLHGRYSPILHHR